MNSRAALVGELGVLQADKTRLAHDVVDAAARGRQMIADAEAEAARLVAAAQNSRRTASSATPTPTAQQRREGGPPPT